MTVPEIPVAADPCIVWVIRSEDPVIDLDLPGLSFIFFPAFYDLGAGDHSFQRFYRTVCDAGILCSRIRRIDIFAIYARHNEHFVTRFCDFRRCGDRKERMVLRTAALGFRILVHVIDHCFSSKMYADSMSDVKMATTDG